MNWGCWGSKLSTAELLGRIDLCVELGITTFDHADIYGHYTTEAELGQALHHRSHLRTKMQHITKCGIRLVTPNRPDYQIRSYDTSAQHILASAERSLINLKTDYLDVLLIHRPDPLLDPDEIAEAFTQLKAAGKVLHFGVSNFTPSQCSLLHHYFPLLTNQVEVSILHLDPFLDGSLDHCRLLQLIPTAWGPLGSGKLFSPEHRNDRTERILAVANLLGERYQLSSDQILLSWLHTHPGGIIPVLGTANPDRLQQAWSSRDTRLTREEWYMLWRASTGKEVP